MLEKSLTEQISFYPQDKLEEVKRHTLNLLVPLKIAVRERIKGTEYETQNENVEYWLPGFYHTLISSLIDNQPFQSEVAIALVYDTQGELLDPALLLIVITVLRRIFRDEIRKISQNGGQVEHLNGASFLNKFYWDTADWLDQFSLWLLNDYQKQHDIARREQALNAFGAITTILSQSLDIHEMLQATLEQTIALTGAGSGLVRLVDETSGDQVIVAHHNISATYLEEYGRIGHDNHIARYVLENNSPLEIRVREDYLPFSENKVIDREGFGSSITVPLNARSGVVGTISTVSDEWQHFREKDTMLLLAIGGIVGISIENANLYTHISEWTIQLETVQSITSKLNRLTNFGSVALAIAEETTRLIDYDSCRVYTLADNDEDLIPMAWHAGGEEYEEDGTEVLKVKMGQGITGWAAKYQIPLNVGNAEADSRGFHVPGTDHVEESMLAVPMVYENHTVGVIVLHKIGLNQFNDAQLRLIKILAGQAAIALENARLIEQVQRDNENLKNLDKLKADFIAVVSHELRTPLTSILAYSEALRVGVVGSLNTEQMSFVKTIERNGQNQLRIVNDLLRISRIEAQQVNLDLQKVDLPELVAEVIKIMQPVADQRSILLEAQLDLDLPQTLADIDNLRQIFLNLMDNSLKFTPAGGKVTVTATSRNRQEIFQSEMEQELCYRPLSAKDKSESIDEQNLTSLSSVLCDRYLLIGVHDTGIGIPSAYRERIFERFTQVEGGPTRHYKGTGLGLYIVRTLVELHGGRIWVTDNEGNGASFFFTICTLT